MRGDRSLPVPSKFGLSVEVPEDTSPAQRCIIKPLDLAHWVPAIALAESALVLWKLSDECPELRLLGIGIFLHVGLRRGRRSWRCFELRGVVVVTSMLDLL